MSSDLEERIKELEAVVEEKDELIEEMNSQLEFAESAAEDSELQKEITRLKEELEEARALPSQPAGGSADAGESNAVLTEEIAGLKARLEETKAELQQSERTVAELKEDKNNTEALIEEWTVQREKERKRAEEAVEEVAKAHDTMRKLGIKFENDKGGNIEDPVAAAFKEKEEGWYNEREVLEKQIAALEVEAAGLKEENEKQMEVRRALFAAMPRSSPYPIRDFFPPPLHPSNSSSSARSLKRTSQAIGMR